MVPQSASKHYQAPFASTAVKVGKKSAKNKGKNEVVFTPLFEYFVPDLWRKCLQGVTKVSSRDSYNNTPY